MKKITLLLMAIILLASCSNSYIEDGESKTNPYKETTLEVLNWVDTSETYYVLIEGNTLYAVSTSDEIVRYKIRDQSGGDNFLILYLLLLFLVMFIIAIKTTN